MEEDEEAVPEASSFSEFNVEDVLADAEAALREADAKRAAETGEAPTEE